MVLFEKRFEIAVTTILFINGSISSIKDNKAVFLSLKITSILP